MEKSKVYVVMWYEYIGDFYEGWDCTILDTVYSTLEKGEERIKELFDKEFNERCVDLTNMCERCSDKCKSGHDCFYDNIEISNPKRLEINFDKDHSIIFYVEERTLDEPPKEAV